jgi:hypothetical protein
MTKTGLTNLDLAIIDAPPARVSLIPVGTAKQPVGFYFIDILSLA